MRAILGNTSVNSGICYRYCSPLPAVISCSNAQTVHDSLCNHNINIEIAPKIPVFCKGRDLNSEAKEIMTQDLKDNEKGNLEKFMP